MSSSDYVVIGAGLAGASAAWRLAARGETVTVLERTTYANPEGSSHGSARIFRFAHSERFYTDLAVRSRQIWDELERNAGTQLIAPTGAVDFGQQRASADRARILDAADVEHELLSAKAATERWPQFNFDTDVLWHPGAGVLDASSAVGSMLQLAEATGKASVLDNWSVASVERSGTGGFVVRSAAGDVVKGKKVIVAAGAWLPRLLSDLALPGRFVSSFPQLQVRQEETFHMPWREADEDGNPCPAWPTFIHQHPAIRAYGLPGGRDADFGGQKLAEFNGGRILPSAAEQNGQIREEMREKIIAYATEFLPGVVPEPYAETTCLFTNTVNEDFIIDEADGVVVISACSGHGAKYASLIGELAADLATGTDSVPERFRAASHG